MINLPCFLQIFRKIISINIREYANELICTFEYKMKGNV